MQTIHLLTDHFSAGGIGVVVEQEVLILAKFGFKVKLVCNVDGALPQEQWETMNPGVLGRISHPLIELIAINTDDLMFYLERLSMHDVVIVHTSWRGRGFSRLKYKNWSNKNCFFFVHNSSSSENIKIDSTLYENLRSAKGVFCGSKFVLNDLIYLFPDASLGEVPYGVDRNIFNTVGTKPFQYRKRKVIYVGRLLHEKGAHLIPSVAEIIKTDGIEFLIHGAFREKELVSSNSLIAETKHAVEPFQMAELYRESTILLVPSLRGEGQPLCVLEAAACKTVVLATNYALGGFDDTSFAFLTESDPVRIAASISKVFDSMSVTEGKLQKGYKITQTLTWENHVNLLLNYIKSRGYLR
jgi:glycosyltransferase involved in cell wall biosynthesis